jgi:hypothetical protein
MQGYISNILRSNLYKYICLLRSDLLIIKAEWANKRKRYHLPIIYLCYSRTHMILANRFKFVVGSKYFWPLAQRELVNTVKAVYSVRFV